MTATRERPAIGPAPIPGLPHVLGPKGSFFRRLLSTTDHKLIGRMYLVTAFAVRPPNRNSQNDSAFSRGKATSRAPICSGMR